MQEKALKTIENFDQSSSDSKTSINSPRSIEALRRQGIELDELIKLTKEKIREKYKHKIFATEDLFKEFCNHYEERRLQKIDAVKKERLSIIEEEELKTQKTSASKIMNQTGSIDGLKSPRPQDVMNPIEKEKLIVEKLEKRQNKEIQMKLDFEMQIEELRTQNEIKMIKQKEKQMRIEEEMNEKRKLAEEKKLKLEEDRQRKLQIEAEEKKKMSEKMRQEELERAKREQIKEEERKKIAKLKEVEKQKKQELISKQIEATTKKRDEDLQKKQKEFEEKERIRKAKFEEENEQRRKIVQAQREIQEKKILLAKEKNELLMNNKRKDFEKKQGVTEAKRKQFEEEQRKMLELLKKESIRRSEEIRRVLDNNLQMEEKKRHDYQEKLKELDKRRQELEKKMKFEEEMRLKREQDKEIKRKIVVETNYKLMEDRTKTIMDKLHQTDFKVQKAKERLKHDLTVKRTAEYFKRMDREENVERIQVINEYKQQKIWERIERDAQRTAQKRKELDDLMKLRMKLRAELDLKKEKLMSSLSDNRKRKWMISTQFSSLDGLSVKKRENRSQGHQSIKGNDSFESLDNKAQANESQKMPKAKDDNELGKSIIKQELKNDEYLNEIGSSKDEKITLKEDQVEAN